MSRRLSNSNGALQLSLKQQSSSRRKRSRNNRRRTRLTNYPARMSLRNVARGPSGILAGYGSPITTVFNQRRIDDGLIIRGLDLVTSFDMGDNISYFMTANPAAWNGTRIAAVAAGFQNYRPLKFVIHYRPQVGSTSDVSMFIGTIWQNNYITSRSQIEPSLLTSPGGVYTPAWQSTSTQVNVGNCLPQRMYPIRDPHFTTVPFAVVARASNGGPSSESVAMPGRIFIEYTYEFRNAIGSGSGFQPSGAYNVKCNATGDGRLELQEVNDLKKGWIIDYINPEESELAMPSNEFPLFAQYTVDTSDEGYYVCINGTRVATTNTTPVYPSLIVYTDDGLPN